MMYLKKIKYREMQLVLLSQLFSGKELMEGKYVSYQVLGQDSYSI